MINYSIVMRGNPTDKTVAKKAYASAQYSEVMDINRFAEHIASHGCVYKRSDIVAILTMSVDCMREQLLAGQKIQLGDLGSFYISINSISSSLSKLLVMESIPKSCMADSALLVLFLSSSLIRIEDDTS